MPLCADKLLLKSFDAPDEPEYMIYTWIASPHCFYVRRTSDNKTLYYSGFDNVWVAAKHPLAGVTNWHPAPSDFKWPDESLIRLA